MEWIDLYQQELGIDPTSRQQLFDAVRKDMVAAHHGDKAAKRRVSAYFKAQRPLDRKVAADDADEDENDASDEN